MSIENTVVIVNYRDYVSKIIIKGIEKYSLGCTVSQLRNQNINIRVYGNVSHLITFLVCLHSSYNSLKLNKYPQIFTTPFPTVL